MHFSRMCTARSSSHLLGGGLPQCMLGYTPPGLGLDTFPQTWAWNPPGVGLETPPRVWAWRHPPQCGLETPQVYMAWRPPLPARPPNLPPGCGPGDPPAPSPHVDRILDGNDGIEGTSERSPKSRYFSRFHVVRQC